MMANELNLANQLMPDNRKPKAKQKQCVSALGKKGIDPVSPTQVYYSNPLAIAG